jgi:hypothetical protein
MLVSKRTLREAQQEIDRLRNELESAGASLARYRDQ